MRTYKFKGVDSEDYVHKNPWVFHFTIGKNYHETEHDFGGFGDPFSFLRRFSEVSLIGNHGKKYVVPRIYFTRISERKFYFDKIKTFLISLFFWLRVLVYYSSAFFIAYNYYMTHDFLITVPMCLIFISFLMADKLLIKL